MNEPPHTIQSYRDLVAWQRAFTVGLASCRVASSLPPQERFELSSQLRRAGVSIATNIAEGYGRGSTTDYVRFLKIARGSLYEVDTLLLFCVELSYINSQQYTNLKEQLDEAERVLAGLIRSLERKHRPA